MKKLNWNGNWTYRRAGGDVTVPVTVPHDAMLHGGRDPMSASGSAQAFFTAGRHTYEKTFSASAEMAEQHVLLQFEGVYKNAQVWINEIEAGGAPYGYIPFFACADGLLHAGENTVRVACDNENQPDSRWYSGAGIYRPVWLWSGGREYIEPEGIRISTKSAEPPTVRIDVAHTGGEGSAVTVEICDGETVLYSGAVGEIVLPEAKLWSADAPKLYLCRARLERDGDVLDTAETRFGIRQLSWSRDGFFVNGESVLLRGGCVHHDNGILGAAAFDESEYRRVRMLKQAGFNAIRSSHNPTSRAMLDACDELGMYLMDEGWDIWFHHKNKYDYASDWRKHHMDDLAAMVSRDFNHPSVILYSIGNEVSEPAKPEGLAAAREMADYLRAADPNRAVTGGMNLMIINNAGKGKGVYNEEGGRKDEDYDKKFSGMSSTMFNMITNAVGTGMNNSANSSGADKATTPLLECLDICGYNYASGRYKKDGILHPDRVIFGSETFPQNIVKNWALVKQYPYLVGDFMWTSWDYLGENGLGAWAYTSDGKGFNKPYPWLLAECGTLDILGDPNGEMFLAQAAWGLLDKPMIAVQPVNHPGVKPAKMVWRGTNAIPSWSWQGCEGNAATVEVYTDAAAVELLLNGRSLGKRKVRDCKAVFKTKYAPGKLEAVSFDAGGRQTGRNALVSAAAAGVHIKPEKETVRPGEIVYIPVEIGDGTTVESNADRMLSVSVAGGELLAFGSANPRTEEDYLSGSFSTYYGHALAVVRAGQDDAIRVTVSGESLDPAVADIRVSR